MTRRRASEGAAVPRLEAAMPGLYKVTYYANGCEPVSVSVMLEEAWSLQRRVADTLAASLAAWRADETAHGAWKLPWQQAWLAGGTEDETARAFAVQGIPRLVLIDHAGWIVATDEGLRGAALDAILAKWLGDN